MRPHNIRKRGTRCGVCPPNRGCNGSKYKNYKTRKDKRFQRVITKSK